MCAFSFSESSLKQQYPRNLTGLFPNAVPSDANKFQLDKAGLFFLLGSLAQNDAKVNRGWIPLLESNSSCDDNIVFMEQGFLASAESWAPQFRYRPESACLGYVYDDIAQYYMAKYPNRLIQKLNSSDELDRAETYRTEALINTIRERKISKYNNQPIVPVDLDDSRRKVLVCDQAYADASTTFGLIDDFGFERMLAAAKAENPDALVIVKTHPDTSWQPDRRTGYYNHLDSYENLLLFREPVNPYQLFELVDKVYVGTSQMGLEALIAGKDVVCFGAPFFAGWGLTDDRRDIPHRKRGRSLEDIFYFFYVWYTIYQVPGKELPGTIEDALDYIEQHRPVYVPPAAIPNVGETPLVSVILPVFSVAQYIEAAILSAQKQTLYNIEIIPVDDASVDGSTDILRKLAEGDPRICPIFLDENIGQGFARNEGLTVARGKYIWFLDSDDYFASLDHLEKAVQEAEESNADMVRCRKCVERIETTEGMFLYNRLDETEEFFDQAVSGVDFASYPTLLHNRHFCNYLYRNQFLKQGDIRFRTPRWEERSFVLDALLKAKRISTVDSDAFVYRIRSDSTARRAKTLDDVEYMVRNFEEVMKLLKEWGANNNDSPLYQHFCFNGTQFIHYIFCGFSVEVLSTEANKDRKTEYYDRITEVLQSSGFDHRCISTQPTSLDGDWLEQGRYGVIVEALRSGNYALVDTVINGRSVAMRWVHKLYFKQPESGLSIAINAYARDGLASMDDIDQRAEAGTDIKVIIHIGSTKSGSTFLQHWLDRNRPGLFAQGIYYPEVGLFRQKGRPHKTSGHARFIAAAMQGDFRLLDHINAVIANSDGHIHTVLLSSETYFLNRNAPQLCDYFSDFDVRMVVYLRPQDSWANSQYCEFVAGGANARVSDSVEEWLADATTRRYLSYNTMLMRWERYIGVGNITVRPFIPSAFTGGSLQSDFANIIGINDLSGFAQVGYKERNTSSLNQAYIELLRNCNENIFRSQDHYFSFIEGVRELFDRFNDVDRSGPVQMLSAEQCQRLSSDYAEGNREIARRYLGDDGILFPDSDQSLAEPDNPGTISAKEVSAILALLDKYRKPVNAKRALHYIGNSHEIAKYSYDYGPLQWRKRLFVPLLSPLVLATTSEAELKNFQIDPAGFVRMSDTWKTRIVRKFCFP